MAPKRKNNGPDKAELQREGSRMEEASSEFAKPVYLVAERFDEMSPYCVIQIDAAAGSDEPRRCRTVAALPGTERGMSFVVAHSERGSWIVGVGGGPRAGTIIFDPDTLQICWGPRLFSPKYKPVLISHGDKVYALSSRPRVVPSMDRVPWFESLDFSIVDPGKMLEYLSYWEMLPPPPFFPSLLDPFEFRYPTEISVTAYTAVGSHILISGEQVRPPQQMALLQVQQERITGTYAFHVVNETWVKVHNSNLPFVGQAVPLGGNFFAACPAVSCNDGIASVFHISMKESPSTSTSAPLLSVQALPVEAVGDKVPRPLFCTLGKDSFCTIRLGSTCQSRRNLNCLKEIQVILTAFQIEKQSVEAVFTSCLSDGAEIKDLIRSVQVKEQSHTYKIKGRSRLLIDSEMPIVAALSMDRVGLELFVEKRKDTRERKDICGTVFEAPVIRYVA